MTELASEPYVAGIDLRCAECDTLFYFQEDFTNHMAIKHEINCPYECKQCGEGFKEREHFILHYDAHCRTKSCEGKECNKRAMSRESETTHNERPFICDLCGKTFKSQFDLKQHVNGVHTTKRGYRCPVCCKSFKTNRARQAHHKAVHVIIDQHYQCEKCNRSFKMERYLQAHHSRVHDRQIRFKCDCGKGFWHKSEFTRHSRIHSGVRAFVCGSCGKSFIYKWHLSRHQKAAHRTTIDEATNRTESPHRNADQITILTENQAGIAAKGTFQCPTCDATYSSNWRLDVHKRLCLVLKERQRAEASNVV